MDGRAAAGPAMTRRSWRWIIGTAVAVPLVVLAGALVFFAALDPEQFREPIRQAAIDATGRELVIEGPISFAVLPGPRVVVEDARMANASGHRCRTISNRLMRSMSGRLPQLALAMRASSTTTRGPGSTEKLIGPSTTSSRPVASIAAWRIGSRNCSGSRAAKKIRAPATPTTGTATTMAMIQRQTRRVMANLGAALPPAISVYGSRSLMPHWCPGPRG